MALTNAERQKRSREKIKENGLAEVRGIFADPALHDAIRKAFKSKKKAKAKAKKKANTSTSA